MLSKRKKRKQWQEIGTACMSHITLKFAGFSEIAVIMDSSPSKTNAGPEIYQITVKFHTVRRLPKIRYRNSKSPEKNSPSFPVIFATEPSGARLP